MENKSHLTAIRRNYLSAPMRWMCNNGLRSSNWLDYGCGYGGDCDKWRLLYNMENLHT